MRIKLVMVSLLAMFCLILPMLFTLLPASWVGATTGTWHAGLLGIDSATQGSSTGSAATVMIDPRIPSTIVPVCNLQPSWDAAGGGGVFSAYIGPPDYSYVSPGNTDLYNGREAGIIKAGLALDLDGHYWDEGLLAFKVNADVSLFASQVLSYDVQNETGANPVWVRIRLKGGTQYQFIPTTNPAGWHIVNAAAGQWQLMDSGGNGTGPLMTLAQVAAANTGATVDRVYLTLGMGDSYNVSPGVGTVAWVDKITIGGVTYDFVKSCTPPTVTATASPNPAFVDMPVHFSSIPKDGVPSYVYDWDFGDGSAHGNVQNPSHTYSAPGVYTVRITVTDDIDNTAKATITLSIVYSAVGSGAPPSHGAGTGAATSYAPPVALPNLSVQSASLSSAAVEPNTPITLTALVGNKSTVNGAKNIKVYINGQEETSGGVTINSGETRTMTFRVSRSQPGTYTVYVEGTPAGSFTVKDSTDTVLLVLSAAALLAAILGLIYMLRRRQGYN